MEDRNERDNAPRSFIGVFGDALVDSIFTVDEMPETGADAVIRDVERRAGGSGSNSARALARTGLPVRLFGTVGEDRDGEWLIEDMRKAGLDTTFVGKKGRTGFVLSMVDKKKERTMFSFRGAAAEPLRLDLFGDTIYEDMRLLLLSGYVLSEKTQAEQAIRIGLGAKERGIPVAFDPSPVIGILPRQTIDSFLSVTDILLPNKMELLSLSGETNESDALRRMAEKVPCIALKRGCDGGSLVVRQGFSSPRCLISAQIRTDRPALPVKVLHTTGAGDAFNAGFLRAFLTSLDPPEWLDSAQRFAAARISASSPDALPDRD